MTVAHAFAHGRVNLIGEHTDYNGGLVLPAALSVKLEIRMSVRADDHIYVQSQSMDGTANRRLRDKATGHWSDAAVGAIIEVNRLGLLSGGADLEIRSAIPSGSGLSSSAALIVAIIKAARQISGKNLGDTEIAVAARRVENDFMSVPCGIMDQMAVAIAKPGEAMALDTGSLAYEILSLPKTHAMVVMHSGLTRRLADGRYAMRKEECDTAKTHFGTNDLCLLEPAEIAKADLPGVIRRRTLHCASEHRRVIEAVAALKRGDIKSFGALMIESHRSMAENFEISTPEIDRLVDTALSSGAVGARLTGGGFGGCIVACVPAANCDEWANHVLQQHERAQLIDMASAQAAEPPAL